MFERRMEFHNMKPQRKVDDTFWKSKFMKYSVTNEKLLKLIIYNFEMKAKKTKNRNMLYINSEVI